jgi:hypothetical protein
MASHRRLHEHADSEIWSSTDSESENDLETDLDLDEIDDFESMDMDEPSHENSSLTNRFTTRHGASSANREWIQGDFSPSLYSFDSSKSGINRRLPYNQLQNPVDFFRIFFDQNLMETIVRQTNMYQSQNSQSSSSHMASWVDVSVSELYVFLAMTILMSQVKKHKIREYWSTDPLIETPIFGTIFARDRYDSLLRYLHFVDNEKVSSSDRLSKFGLVLDDLKKKFSNVMYPYQNLVIDESLMLWKGRLDFKQYVPSKRSRFGIKLYMLCDCRTGFILDFLVYTGLSTSVVRDNTLGISGAIVMKMIEKYLYRGHNLFVDD